MADDTITLTFTIRHPWLRDFQRREAFRSVVRQPHVTKELQEAVAGILSEGRGVEARVRATLSVDDDFDVLRPVGVSPARKD